MHAKLIQRVKLIQAKLIQQSRVTARDLRFTKTIAQEDLCNSDCWLFIFS